MSTRLFEAKPFVIAEVGSNWTSLEHCLHSIGVAKQCGADAVKFQAFTFRALYGPVSGLWNGSRSELPLEWLPYLKGKADAESIEFMCTAFSPELIAEVDPYVSVHKIASSDAAWSQLLSAVAKTGKPILLSLGAKTDNDIDSSLHILGCYSSRIVPLLCVAAYPADYVDLESIGEGVGFSDHTLGFTAAVDAARRGATVIEKHFTAFPDLDTPDCAHSLTPTQFTRMVKLIRGEPVESEEQPMFLRHNRRLIATCSIPAGQVLKYGDNYGAYRSLVDDTRGASPLDWEKVEGKSLSIDKNRGDSIALDDVS